jgi:ketosteroid isomerase-like protein
MANRTRISLLIAVSALFALTGCIRQPGTNSAKVADEVRKDAAELVADYNAQNADAASASDAPDYVGIYHGAANTVGPAADLAGMRATMAAAKVHWQIGEGKVTVSRAGDLGIFEAPYSFTITTPQGGVSTEAGNWIAIFKRGEDGKLKLWRSIASDTPQPKAGA